MATIGDFEKLDIRVGKIIEIENLSEARKPHTSSKELVLNEITDEFSPARAEGTGRGGFLARLKN